MSRGRESDGEAPLSNAARQARYRARQKEKQTSVIVRSRRPVDRRSRLQRWHDAIAERVDLQAGYAAWLDALPASLRGTATGECQGSCRLNSVMISSYRRCRCACGVDVWRCGLPTGDECATVLTAEKVRCSPSSPCSRATGRAARGCGWLCSSHLLRCAPRLGRCQVGTGKQARRSNRKAGFVRLPPG